MTRRPPAGQHEAVAPLGSRGILRAELAARAPGLLLCLLALTGAVVLVAGPRAQATAADADIRHLLDAANPAQRGVTVEVRFGRSYSAVSGGAPGRAPFDAVDESARRILGPQATRLVRPVEASAATLPFALSRPARPFGIFREAVVRVDPGLEQRVRWDAGRAPGRSSETRVVVGRGLRSRTPVVPVALASGTAQRWGVRVGDLLRTDPRSDDRDASMPMQLRVVGTYTPLDPADEHWRSDPLALGSVAYPGGDGEGSVERTSLLVSPAAYGALGSALLPDEPARDGFALGLFHTWSYVVRTDRVTDPDVPVLRSALTRLQGADQAWGPQRPQVRSGLPGVFDRHRTAVATTAVVVDIVSWGVVVLIALLAALAATAVVRRRRPTLDLLAARGASPARVAALLTAALAGWVTAGAVAGALLGWAVTPDGRGGRLLGVLALVVGPLGVAAALAGRRVTLGPGRRVVIEVALLSGALLAVLSLRSRGGSVGTDQPDPYAALAPVLVALAAAVVAIRLHPLPTRALARLASRGTGARWFLALTRSAREGAAGLVPTTAIVVAATLVTFLAGVATSVERERGVAAYRLVGADVRVDLDRVDPQDPGRLAARPGMGAVTAAWVGGATVYGEAGAGSTAVLLVAVDPTAYADIVSGTPLAFSPDPFSGWSARDPRALSSNALEGARQIEVSDRMVPVRMAGVAPGLAREASGAGAARRPVVLMPLSALQESVSGLRPNTLFARADADAARALAEGRSLTPLVQQVVTRTGRVEEVASRPLSQLVTLSVVAGGAASLALSLLAVVLLLTLSAPARRELLVRLRTMGLAPRGDWRLGVGEVLPLALTAAVVGAGLGCLVPGLLGGALDLAPYTGGPPHPPVRPSAGWTIMVVVLALVVAVVALLIDQVRARRSDLTRSLRTGDRA